MNDHKLTSLMRNILALLIFLFFACDAGPKRIQAVNASENNHDHQTEGKINISPSNQQHEVVVNEVLNTSRYTYLQVSEGQEEFWIAVPVQPVEVGETYFYQGGLLKKNFESKEFGRIFETLYLVSAVTKKTTLPSQSVIDQVLSEENPKESTKDLNITPVQDGITIAELVENANKYEGKEVKITGLCTKVNPMIMGRNWVHLQDGSGEDYDLTITTQERIPEGAIVTLKGKVALNKDFGAGYRYDIIVEEAVLN